MSFLRSVRPSNLIILTALPFIIYLFISSGDYQRSLKAILGVENGSSVVVPGFLALAIAFCSGIAVLIFSRAKAPRPRLANLAALLNLAAAAVLVVGHNIHPFVASVVANGVDPFKSTLIVKGVTPRQLTEAADLVVRGVEAWLFPSYFAVTVVGLGLHFLSSRSDASSDGKARRFARWTTGLVNGAGLVFVFFFAHIAFAAGVATTIRAAIAAYILAALMGLVWVGLLQLRSTARTSLYFALATLVLALASGWFLLQPRDAYVLAGTLDGKVGIVTNTPAGLISAVRFGQYDGARRRKRRCAPSSARLRRSPRSPRAKVYPRPCCRRPPHQPTCRSSGKAKH